MSPVTTGSPPLPSSPFPHLTMDLPNMTTAAATRNDTDDERNERLAVIEVAISGTILFLAVVGNSIVVMSLMLKRGKLSRMHLMMLHLSLADLSVAFFQVLPQMVWDITFRFQGGAFLCGAVKYLQLVTMYGSSYVLMSTAVDRYVAICKPFLSQKWTSTHAHLLVLAAWLASLVFSLPQVFIFSLSEVKEGTGVYDCWASFHPPWTLKLYIIWNIVSVFIAPTLTLAVLYGHISYAVWKSSKMAENLAPRYVPLSKEQTEKVSAHANSNQGKKAWQNTAPTSAHDGNAHIDAHQDRIHPGTTHDTGILQNSPAMKPRSKGQCSEATAQQTTAGGGHQGELALTQSAVSDGGKPRLQGTTSCPFLSDDACRSGRPTTNGTKFGDTKGTGSLRNSHQTGRSRDIHGTGSSRNVPGAVSGPSTSGVGISRAKMKTIKLTLTVVICYLVCWTPFYVAQLWAAFDEDIQYDNIFFTVILLLASVNSCTNPWIYMVFSDTICNTLRAIADNVDCCFRSSSHLNPGSRGRHTDVHSSAYRSSPSTGTMLTRSDHTVVNGASRI